MAERLADLIKSASIATAAMREHLEHQDYEGAQTQSRVLLSLSSRLHARLTGIVEAQAELDAGQ